MFEKGYLSLGVRIFTAFPIAFVVGGGLLILLTMVSFGILVGPCFYGLANMTRRALRGEDVTLADAFSGFEERFGSAFLAGVAFLLLVGLGKVFLVLPGLVVAAILIWMFPMLVDDESSSFRKVFVGSIEFLERDFIHRGLFSFVMVLIGAAGFLPGAVFPLFFLLGLVTSAFSVVTISAGYFREMHPEEEILLPEDEPVMPSAPPAPPAEPSASTPPATAKKASTTKAKAKTKKAKTARKKSTKSTEEE